MPSKRNRKRRERKKGAKSNKNTNVEEGPSLKQSEVEDVIQSIVEHFERSVCLTNLEKFVVDADDLEDHFYILGEGSFGLVTLGVLHRPGGKSQKVAIKAAQSPEFDQMILDEAEIMVNLDHENVIKLVAVQKLPLKIAMEFMVMGDVLDAIEMQPFTDKDLLSVLYDVASGMEYIANKDYIHLDLACRNVFVNASKQAKIGDFGLSKFVGDTNGVFIVPHNFRRNQYSAPELLISQKCTTKSDSWSMGLLIWELYFSAGEGPVVLKVIMMDMFYQKGLPQPNRCSNDLYLYVTNRLLYDNPKKRPGFTDIKERIKCLMLKLEACNFL